MGNFEWTLTFAPPWVSESSWPSIYTAMQEQLGLKLEAGRIRADVLVIDSAAKPSVN